MSNKARFHAILLEALAADIGVVVQAPERERVMASLNTLRGSDPIFSELSIRRAPIAEDEIWIFKKAPLNAAKEHP